MSVGFRGVVGEDGMMRCPGFDYGTYDPQVIYQNGDFCVVKVRGSRQWSGVGQTKYYSTSYHLCQKVDPGKPTFSKKWPEGYVYFKLLEEQEPGRKWKSCIGDLKDKADQLAKKAGKQ